MLFTMFFHAAQSSYKVLRRKGKFQQGHVKSSQALTE